MIRSTAFNVNVIACVRVSIKCDVRNESEGNIRWDAVSDLIGRQYIPSGAGIRTPSASALRSRRVVPNDFRNSIPGRVGINTCTTHDQDIGIVVRVVECHHFRGTLVTGGSHVGHALHSHRKVNAVASGKVVIETGRPTITFRNNISLVVLLLLNQRSVEIIIVRVIVNDQVCQGCHGKGTLDIHVAFTLKFAASGVVAVLTVDRNHRNI